MRHRLRSLNPPRVVPPPTAVQLRTRLRLSDGDERVLRALGDHLGHLASRDLAARCRLGTRHRRQDWAIRKRALSCECSSRWAGSITSWNNAVWELAWANQTRHLSQVRAAINTTKAKLARPILSGPERRQQIHNERQAALAEARRARRLEAGYRSRAEHAVKRQRLRHLEEVERQLAANREAGRVSIVRGGRRLAKNRFHLAKMELTEQSWVQRWQASRWFLYARGETGTPFGNSTIRITPDGIVLIHLPKPLAHLANAPRDRYQLAARATFHYRGDEWTNQVVNRRAVAYMISLDPDRQRWYLSVSFTPAPPVLVALADATTHGVLGVDLNIDHLAAWVLDSNGNPVAKPYYIPLNLDALRASTRDGRLRAAVSTLIRLALAAGVGAIAVEDLGFANEKAISRETYNKQFRRKVHEFPTAAFRNRLIGMAHRARLAVVAVDPAYSSIWGSKHWQAPLSTTRRPVSRHEAASVVLGRRALGLGARRRSGVIASHQRMEAAEPSSAGAKSYRPNPGQHPDSEGVQEPRSPRGAPAARLSERPAAVTGTKRATRPANTVRDGP
jgi:IS605 OrfB family transposase